MLVVISLPYQLSNGPGFWLQTLFLAGGVTGARKFTPLIARQNSPRRNPRMNRYIGTAGLAIAALCTGGVITTAHAQSGGPSDPQIVGIVLTANQIDIDQGKMALQHSKNKEVRDFAQQMVDDHSALQKSVKDLGAKLRVTPADSETATSLKAQAATEADKLKGLNGDAFDKEYIDHEVAYHKAVIDAAGNVLIPNAQNAELKSALQSAAPLFQGHLEHAQRIQTEVDGGSH
jgi:putative membrane protein